jgi:hypothetical protein
MPPPSRPAGFQPILIPVVSPIRGVVRSCSAEQQPELTAPNALNVLPYDLLGRKRVGQRYGTAVFASTSQSTYVQGMLPIAYILPPGQAVGDLPPYENFPLTSTDGSTIGAGTAIINWNIIPPNQTPPNQYLYIAGTLTWNWVVPDGSTISDGFASQPGGISFSFYPTSTDTFATGTNFGLGAVQIGPGNLGSAYPVPNWSQISSEYPSTNGVLFVFASCPGSPQFLVQSTVVPQGSGPYSFGCSQSFVATFAASQGSSTGTRHDSIGNEGPAGANSYWSNDTFSVYINNSVWDFGPLSTEGFNLPSGEVALLWT